MVLMTSWKPAKILRLLIEQARQSVATSITQKLTQHGLQDKEESNRQNRTCGNGNQPGKEDSSYHGQVYSVDAPCHAHTEYRAYQCVRG